MGVGVRFGGVGPRVVRVCCALLSRGRPGSAVRAAPRPGACAAVQGGARAGAGRPGALRCRARARLAAPLSGLPFVVPLYRRSGWTTGWPSGPPRGSLSRLK
ncbi:hypothetical protein ATKI12_8817 [Kitasatospora sp. Ki12]